MRDRGPTDVRLTTADTVRLWVNDRLVCEVAAGLPASRDALLAEVERARRLEWLPRMLGIVLQQWRAAPRLADHVHKTPVARQAAFVRGFGDGLELRTEPHAYPCVPDVLPEHTTSYRVGYSLGRSLGDVVRQLIA